MTTQNIMEKEVDLAVYRNRFKAAVLNHLENWMSPVERARLRSMADRRCPPGMSETLNLAARNEELLDASICNDSISVREACENAGTVTEIGLINWCPIYYIENSGVYIWGPQIDSRETLTFWLTTPAWPPGW